MEGGGGISANTFFEHVGVPNYLVKRLKLALKVEVFKRSVFGNVPVDFYSGRVSRSR